MRTTAALLVAICATTLCKGSFAMTSFDAGPLRVGISDGGQVVSLLAVSLKTDFLASGKAAPLLTVTIGEKPVQPTGASFDNTRGILTLTYGDAGTATVRMVAKTTHVTFELISLEGMKPTRIEWGPIPTTIGDLVGETIGVARGKAFALGIQGLNVKTIGGATKTDYGSALSACTIEHEGGVAGSKVALFGCPVTETLATIGRIEVAEGLPHPMLDGKWGKVSPTARLSYLICPYGERNLDAVLDYATKGGFTYVYHPGPFETWGHFRLNPDEFPDGDDSLKRCVERAAKRGIRLGVHTLTGFITPNDPYVTPAPDPRLARSGSTTLAAAIDEKATEIPVAEGKALSHPVPWEKPMDTVIIGKELVQYEKLTDGAPGRLLGCKRGAFGTTASAHEAGADVGKLADHAYGTFYPGIENGMMDEMADRLVNLGNKTGLRQISFDGLEGLSAYGYSGDWTRNRFVKRCFDGWKPEVISDASNSLHFLWHIHTRMNWGEPWGKAMREGMAEYRFANQDYFQRNLMPGMLGWWELRIASGDLEASTLEDFEWMFAKAAGFDAGFAITTFDGALKANGQTPAILEACRQWETARHAGAFTEEQRKRLRDPRGEFHLEAAGKGRWKLWPVGISKVFDCPEDRNQATWEYANPFAEQPLRFVLRVLPGKELPKTAAPQDPTKPTAQAPSTAGGASGKRPAIANPSFSVNGVKVTFAVELKPNQYLVCAGEPVAFVYDANWNLVETVRADVALPRLQAGAQKIGFTCDTVATPRPEMKAWFKTVGPAEAALMPGPGTLRRWK